MKAILPLKASYGKLMMWFFLLSDVFTFATLLISYGFIRANHTTLLNVSNYPSQQHWPIPEMVFDTMPFFPHIHLPLVFVSIMTFILILTSVTMVLAVEAGKNGNKKKVEQWMLWTIIGGLVFLGCQAWEWTHFIHGTEKNMLFDIFLHGEWVKKSINGANLICNEYGPPVFAAFFFIITGFHGLHVLSGVVCNILIFYNTVTGVYEKRKNYEMVEKIGLYWHFIDLVWVFVFTFFYLI